LPGSLILSLSSFTPLLLFPFFFSPSLLLFLLHSPVHLQGEERAARRKRARRMVPNKDADRRGIPPAIAITPNAERDRRSGSSGEPADHVGGPEEVPQWPHQQSECLQHHLHCSRAVPGESCAWPWPLCPLLYPRPGFLPFPSSLSLDPFPHPFFSFF